MTEALESRLPLPGGYRVDVRFDDVLEVAGLRLHMAGIMAKTDDGHAVAGSAANLDVAPFDRAYYELLERACTLSARDRGQPLTITHRNGAPCAKMELGTAFPEPPAAGLRYAFSNGVAVHTDAQTARTSALAELVERDRLLRSWYGTATPQKIDLPDRAPVLALAELYELHAYRFDQRGDAYSVAGVFGFPRNPENPSLAGYGGATTAAAALNKAAGEVLQRLAFLWDEEIPQIPPAPEPTPDFHQEYYLHPGHEARLRAWLGGEHGDTRKLTPAAFDKATFLDLTPPDLVDRVTVVRAMAPGALPLVFGERASLADQPLPDHQRVHPIC